MNKNDFPKVRIKNAYRTEGQEAAVALGKELKIHDTKMQRWLREWSNIRKPETRQLNGDAAKEERVKETEKLLEQRKKKVEIIGTKKTKRMIAYVLTPGPQQSILYIIEGPESMLRKVQCFSNEAFREIAKPKREV